MDLQLLMVVQRYTVLDSGKGMMWLRAYCVLWLSCGDVLEEVGFSLVWG